LQTDPLIFSCCDLGNSASEFFFCIPKCQADRHPKDHHHYHHHHHHHHHQQQQQQQQPWKIRLFGRPFG